MKKICVGFLSAFFGLAAFAAATRAQELDQITVNVPYDFVVSGKTLPAGAYRVKRANDRDNHVLAITSLENGGGVLLLSGVRFTATVALLRMFVLCRSPAIIVTTFLAGAFEPV